MRIFIAKVRSINLAEFFHGNYSALMQICGLGLAGLLGVLAYAPYNKGICLILCLLPLYWCSCLWLLNKVRYRQLILPLFIYAFCFYSAQLIWIFYSLYFIIKTGLLLAIVAQFVFAATMALFIVAAILLFRLLASTSLEYNYLFLFPSCWVSGEWLRGWVLSGFPWSDIAYTQVNNYLLLGIFPLFGSYAVSWLTLSMLGFLFLVLKNHQLLHGSQICFSFAQRCALAYFGLVVLICYCVHGHLYTEAYGKASKIALIQGNFTHEQKWDGAQIGSNLWTYANLLAKTKADIIFFPETAFPVFEFNLPEDFIDGVTALARSNHAQLVVGMPKIINQSGEYASVAEVITQSGHPYYAKTHLVPFGEFMPLRHSWPGLYNLLHLPMVGFSSGSIAQKPIAIAQQKIAFNICYENGFASELIEQAKQSSLMVNLSDLVWFGNTIAKDQHLQLSQARAMENQRYFIQETNTGSSAVITPFGRIQSRLPDFTRGTLIDSVRGYRGSTPYQLYGNYPIMIWSLAVMLLSLIAKIAFKPIT